MAETTSSIDFKAIRKPSKIWARSLARLSSNLRPAANDVLAMFDIFFQNIFQGQNPRLDAVNQGQHIDIERRLHGGEFIQTIENFFRIGVGLKSITILTPSVRSDSSRRSEMPSSFLSLTKSAIFVNQFRFIDLIRNFGNNNAKAAAFVFFDVGHGPHDNPAFAGRVGAFDLFGPINFRAGGKIRTFNKLPSNLQWCSLGLSIKWETGINQLRLNYAAEYWWPCRRQCPWSRLIKDWEVWPAKLLVLDARTIIVRHKINRFLFQYR